MAKNPLIRTYPKKVNKPLPNKSAGILDDFAVRRNILTQDGKIQSAPTEADDITNKAYVDASGVTDHALLTNVTSDQHHPQVHTHTHASTTGQTSDDHHPQVHTHTEADITDLTHTTSLDHTTEITNVGTNTHAQIDTHLANTTNPHSVTLAQVGGTTDHTSLSNIGTNTHAQIDTHLALTNEHLDWTSVGAGTIDPSNYNDNDTKDHLSLSNIGTNTHVQIDTHLALVNEHLDWTGASVGTIDPTNYVDNDTTNHLSFSNIGTNTHAVLDTFKTTTEAIHNSNVKATTTDTQSIPSANYTKVTFENETYDTLNEFDITTNIGRFTAQNAGYYLVTAHLIYGTSAWTAGNLALIVIYKNGALASVISRNTVQAAITFAYDMHGSDVIKLNANDYIEIYAYQNSGSNIPFTANPKLNYFNINRLS